jgi:hypothetical protein
MQGERRCGRTGALRELNSARPACVATGAALRRCLLRFGLADVAPCFVYEGRLVWKQTNSCVVKMRT